MRSGGIVGPCVPEGGRWAQRETSGKDLLFEIVCEAVAGDLLVRRLLRPRAHSGDEASCAQARRRCVDQRVVEPLFIQGIPLLVGQVARDPGFEEGASYMLTGAEAAGIYSHVDQGFRCCRSIGVPFE